MYTEADFQVLEKLGQGGYGVVFKAVQKSTAKYVALKYLASGDSRGFSQSTIREIQTLQRLSHPNLIKYLGVGKADNSRLFAVLEYYPQTLHNIIYGKKLDPAVRTAIIYDVVKGLHHMHSKSFIHRDIKPANILIATDGQEVKAVICDYGVTRWIPNTDYRLTAGPGTRTYRAPELIVADVPYSWGVDLWSLGIVMYEMYTATKLISNRDSEDMNKIARFILSMFLEGADNPEIVPTCSIIDRMRQLVLDNINIHVNKFVKAKPDVEQVAHILEKLLAVNPRKRPNTATVLASLRKAPRLQSS